MSLLNIVIAYLYCICLLHIFIAYLRCISLKHKHIYIAYLCYRVAVFCCLGLGSIFGRFGGVFVRFLVVLGGLRGVLGALLGSWSPLPLPPALDQSTGRILQTSFSTPYRPFFDQNVKHQPPRHTPFSAQKRVPKSRGAQGPSGLKMTLKHQKSYSRVGILYKLADRYF